MQISTCEKNTRNSKKGDKHSYCTQIGKPMFEDVIYDSLHYT